MCDHMVDDQGRLGWYADGVCTLKQIRKIAQAEHNAGREVIVLSGGHGDKFGGSPL